MMKLKKKGKTQEIYSALLQKRGVAQKRKDCSLCLLARTVSCVVTVNLF